MIYKLLDGHAHGIFVSLDRVGSIIRRDSDKQTLFAAYMSTVGCR